MSKPENWKQEGGPLDAGEWSIALSHLGGREAFVYIAQDRSQSAEVTVWTPQHLRDFARALDRAAAALEAAAEPEAPPVAESVDSDLLHALKDAMKMARPKAGG